MSAPRYWRRRKQTAPPPADPDADANLMAPPKRTAGQASLAAFGFTAVKSPSKPTPPDRGARAPSAEPDAKRARASAASPPTAPPASSSRQAFDEAGLPTGPRDLALAAKWAKKVASDDFERRRRADDAPATAAPSSSSRPAAPTPLDRQIAKLKADNPGTVLAIEVGYKFMFFGVDAEIAASVLRVFAYNERGSLRASVPAPGLARAVRRLVGAGHRVGIVRQTETAALKKAGATDGGKSGTFSRAVTAVFTAATLDAGAEADVGPLDAAPPRAGGVDDAGALAGGGGAYLLAVTDEPADGDRALLGAVAVDVSTGDVRAGGGVDAPSRAALERLLLTLAPAEILVLGHPTRATRRALDAYMGGSARGGGMTAVRCEDGAAASGDAAARAVAAFFGTAAASLPDLPPPATIALAAVLHRLDRLKLAAPLRALGGAGVRSLDAVGTLALPPSALAALEVLAPTAGAVGARGSLLWLVDRTRTKAGGRTLRDWLARPLAGRAAIDARMDAVSELRGVAAAHAGVAPALTALPSFLDSTPDVARGLTRALHATASPAEFLATVHALAGAAEALGVPPVDHDAAVAAFPDVVSPLLRSLLAAVADARVRSIAAAALAPLNVAAAATADRVALLADPDTFPRTAAAKAAVAAAEAGLTALLPALKLAAPGAKGYVSVANQGTHLMELAAGTTPPSDWVRVSSTKKVDRYLPPGVGAGLDSLARAQETLAAAAAGEWSAHATSLAPHYAELRAAAAAIAALDALLSLADAAESEGWVRPELQEGGDDDDDDAPPPTLALRSVVHPMLAATTRTEGRCAVPNDVVLGDDGCPPVLVVTGPNMGGKSCVTRAVALAVVMAHAGCHVAAASATLTPVDAVLTRMGASDSLLLARSTFLQEMSETSDILRTATRRSLVLFDELGRGTSTSDGSAIASAVLTDLATRVRCRSLFITHFISRVADDAAASVAVAHMAADVDVDPATGTETVTFRYKLAPGPSSRSYGVNCARLAGLPPTVVDRAAGLASSLASGDALEVAACLPARVAAAVRGALRAAEGGPGLDAAVAAAAAVAGE